MNAKLLYLTLLIGLISLSSYGQNNDSKKLDRIIRKDYQIIDCTISKISDATVEYSLPNETLTISLDVAKIARIDFSSGRTQLFESTEPTANQANEVVEETIQAQGSPKMNTNMIAVLPIPYVNAETLASSEEMAKFAQNDIYNKLIDKSSNIFPLTVQDLRTTNSLLRKAGIDYKNIDEIPIEELEGILGVDNIIAAKVSYTMEENRTSNTYKSGETKYSDDKTKNQNYSSTSDQTEKQYKYNVYFDMYRNKEKIYTHTRQPFFTMKDSWMDAIQYLLKRSPIYTK